MYIKKNSLLESLGIEKKSENGVNLLSLLEADQAKMTSAQKQKDVKKRLDAQTIGIEIEMYSNLTTDETEAYIHHTPDKFPNLKDLIDAKEDGSLDAAGDGGGYGNRRLSDDPFDYLVNEQGQDYETLVGIHIGDGEDTEAVEDKLSEIQHEIRHVLSLIESMELDEDNDSYRNEAVAVLEKANDEVYFDEFVEDTDVFDSFLDDAKSYMSKINTQESAAIIKILDNIENDTDIEVSYDTEKAIAGYWFASGEYEAAHNYLMSQDRSYYADSLREYYWDSDADYEDGLSEKYGVEIVTNKPIALRGSDKIIRDLVDVCNDETIGAHFIDDREGDGNTGLHVHFGISPTIKHSFLDIVRLVLNTNDRISEVFNVAGRGFTDYSKSLEAMIQEFDRTLAELDEEFEYSGKISSEIFNAFYTDRYFGVNLTNLANRPGEKNTVEFRWASSAICADYNSFKGYIDLLTDLISQSFTGENTLEYRDYVLSATADTNVGYYLIRKGNGDIILLNTPYGRDPSYAASRLYHITDGEHDFHKVKDQVDPITKHQFDKYKNYDGPNKLFVIEEPVERESKASPAINVFKNNKLIGKVISKDVHIAGDSSKATKIQDQLSILKTLGNKFGKDSDEYRNKFNEIKDRYGSAMLKKKKK